MSEEEGEVWEQFSGAPPDIGSAIIASKLAEQLGTDTIDLDTGRFDMRRLTVIKGRDLGFLLYARMRAQKSRIWRIIYNEVLNLMVSVDGRGRRDIIRMEAVSKGGIAAVESEITRPGVFARNIYDRNWEERQREERGL